MRLDNDAGQVVVALALAVTALLVGAAPAHSQATPGFPRNYGILSYVVTLGPPPGAVNDLGIDCDDCTKVVAFPFPVNVYGAAYSSAAVSSNGNVQFTTNSTEYENSCLPNASMGVMVAPYWDDLETESAPGYGVFTATTGSSPDRIFTIEWRARAFGSVNSANFAVSFFERPAVPEDGQFEFGYHGTLTGTGATIGVQRADRGLHRQHSCNAETVAADTFLYFRRSAPVADFDGNGGTDIGIFRPSNGTWQLRNGETVWWGTNGDRPAPADYDGDGDSEMAVFRPSTGTWFIRGGAAVPFGTNGDVPVPGNYFLGTSSSRIAIFRPSTGTWFLEGGGAVRQWGTSGDVPVPADYDGDGDLDVAVFRPSNGYWFVQNGPTVQFGTNGDIPVPADYTGDGIVDIAVFRPSNGYWFVRNGPTVQFGANGDIPVPAQYDGDPFKIAVFRPSNGYWFVRNGPTLQFGANGDIPLSRPLGSA